LTKKLNIVWLKRDLRTSDHEPFFHAENHENDYIGVYIFEPKLLSHPDSSLRHRQFIYHSILDMNTSLQPFNRHIHVFYANADEVFSYLTKAYSVTKVFSYQESGIKVSWERDKHVAEILKNNGVEWCEFENQS
jgi:deoxyribodipyrimidine photo-lyase